MNPRIFRVISIISLSIAILFQIADWNKGIETAFLVLSLISSIALLLNRIKTKR
jgi:hypothetical protein